MKFFYLSAVLLMLCACNKQPQIELTVKAPGVKSGTLIIKQADEVVLTENIKDGSLTISKPLQSPGYYALSMMDSDKPLGSKASFDVYLENGKYTIESQPDKPTIYPTITSTSKKQQELSAYYKLAGEMGQKGNEQVNALIKNLDSREAYALSEKKRNALRKTTRLAQTARRKQDPDILNAFIARYPDNTIVPHLMLQQYVEENPELYKAVFDKLSSQAKNTQEGELVAQKLDKALKLLPGALAPDITGNMPDGKTFSKSQLKNKVTLVEFWRPASSISRTNHQKLVKGVILTDENRKAFGIVSVCIDTDANSWISAVKADHMGWPQVSDLKGDNSPNVANWSITTLPVYFLVDQQWHVVKANVNMYDIDKEVDDYMAKHR